MRLSQFHLATVKEVPADAEIASHRLMLRAGMIRKLAAGIYTWTPLGVRVLRKVEGVVREEMDHAGAIELLMPSVQPRELWEETGRWQKFGGQLLKIRDRKEQEFCYGPTHEEVITDFARNELKSYKQLPVNFYQIQTKFRDEIRPRFGVMRAREFLMKDAYSFHLDEEGLVREYDNMYATYGRIFTRLGLAFRAVAADTGAIGGSRSNEFQVLADSGEDALVFSDGSDYAANVELAAALPPGARAAASEAMREVPTPGKSTCADVAALLGIDIRRTVKSVCVIGDENRFVLALVRGDHDVNEVKLGKIAGMAEAWHPPVAPHDCTGPVVYAASCHFSMHARNALIQESVRAFYTGWYTELVTALPKAENGMITISDAPGLGLELLPGLEKRADAIVRLSRLSDG